MTTQTTQKIYHTVERLSTLLRTENRSVGAEFNLQPVHLEALHYLSICNRYSDTPMAVTDYLGQTKGTVSQTLKLLEKRELLTKQADLKDQRKTHLKLTYLGKDIVLKTVPAPQFIKACDQLESQTQVDIAASLKNLLQALQLANNMKAFGICRGCRHNKVIKDGHYFCKLTNEALLEEDVHLICKEYQDSAL